MMGLRFLFVCAVVALSAALAACGDDDDEGPASTDGDGAGVVDPIELTSSAFEDGGAIPEDFTCDGRDQSPPLAWGSRPAGAASLAIIMDDLDVNFIHWVAYDMDPALGGIERIGQTETFPGGGTDNGTNSFGRFGYGGPCPPEGQEHTYRFRLYVLDAPVDLDPGATADELEAAMARHIIAEGELTGTYAR
jgi:Raf kinase inhibitor-like YbhB/YbcL family protein